MNDIAAWFQATAANGTLLLAVPVAVIAGLVSFFSPCVIPLLPGYVSYATGLSGTDLNSSNRGRMVLGSFLFVCGFAFVFVAFGAAFGQLGFWLASNSDTIRYVLGGFTILLGVVFLGVVPFMQRDIRFHKVPAVGLAAAPLLGVLFGLGWAPCIGPTLGVILGLSYSEASASRGALLALAYALGLGIPFILAGLAFHRMLGLIGWIRRRQQWVTRTGGVLMILVGTAILTGYWDRWVAMLRYWISGFSTPV
ncbi:MAG: cytochrome c biosis protein CcdA [Nocardioides sp.]|nr:cytochrome c biosis protein CcdA [Nocardioides sp.]